MIRINRKHYGSLLGIGSSTEDEECTALVAKDDIFTYHPVNYLNNCIIMLLLICHCLHTLLFGGDMFPSIYRFKMDYTGVFALMLNALVPCFFFVQGWLKAFEVHKCTSFFSRLHLEYIFPIIIYILLYLVKILLNDDNRLENLTNEEFATLLSQSSSFNPGFISTFALLFAINLILDPVALVLVPNFYTSNTLVTYTLDISSTSDSISNDNNCAPLRKKEKKYFSVLKRFSTYKLVYCLVITTLYDWLLKYLNSMDFTQPPYRPMIYSYMQIIILFIFCKTFRNRPRIVYFISIASSIYELIIYSSFDSYINNHISTSLTSTIHFLLYIYLAGIVTPCLQLKIFNKWPISIFCMIVSVLCYLISLEYSRSIISPIIFPSILSISSRMLTVTQIFSSVLAIFGLSILSFKHISADFENQQKALARFNYTVLSFLAVMLCTSSAKLFLEKDQTLPGK